MVNLVSCLQAKLIISKCDSDSTKQFEKMANYKLHSLQKHKMQLRWCRSDEINA